MRNKMMALALIILAVALVFPIFALVESWNEDFANLGNRQYLDWTDIQGLFAQATTRHQTLLTILGVSEIVLLVLFILALRAALPKPD